MMRALPLFALAGLLAAVGVRGNQAYRSGDYARAEAEYRRELRRHPESPQLHYNLGTVLLRTGRFAEAAKHLEQARSTTIRPLRQRVEYNRGNADLEPAFGEAPSPQRDPKLRSAIASYKRALVLNPRDQAAKWNLELAQRLLSQPPPPESGGGGGGDEGGGGGQGEADPDPQPSGEGGGPASPQRAEEILGAAEQADAALQRSKLEQGAGRTRVARDW